MEKPVSTKDMLGREALRTVEEAQVAFWHGWDPPRPGEERLSLEEALGRITSREILSPEDLPPFPRSTVDGYAVRAADTFGATETLPAYLRVKGEIPMGEAPRQALGPGEALRIATGGMLPAGADAVLMLEHATEAAGELLEAVRSVAPGENVIQRGEDVARGERLLPPGHALRPQDLGALAGLGILEVWVYRKPRVAILSTGNEVVDPSVQPRPGEIRDINAYNLTGLVLKEGGIPLRMGIVPDEREALARALREALTAAQVVLLSGGSSVGTRDLTPQVIREAGPPGVLVHGVSIRPGKPVILARVGDVPVFGLPGHPAAVTVAFELFVQPVLEKLRGEASVPGLQGLRTRTVRARMARNLASSPGREDHVRVALELRDGELWAVPLLGKSGLITTLVRAAGTVVIPLTRMGIEQGEWVDVRLLA